jgi:hypothetical protein
MTVIYPASKSHHGHWWRALRACGLPISPDCHWIDWSYNEPGAPEPSDDDWRAHWGNCISAAANADVLVFLDLPGETAKGALVEMGAALALGRQVFLVSEADWNVGHHSNCRRFRRLEDCIAAIRAIEAGERARDMIGANKHERKK